VIPPEYGRKTKKAGAFVTQGFDDASEEGIDGGKAVGAYKREDLVDRCEKGHGVDDAQEAKDEETGEPIGGAIGHIRRIFL
jgi:hypothetical protein